MIAWPMAVSESRAAGRPCRAGPVAGAGDDLLAVLELAADDLREGAVRGAQAGGGGGGGALSAAGPADLLPLDAALALGRVAHHGGPELVAALLEDGLEL